MFCLKNPLVTQATEYMQIQPLSQDQFSFSKRLGLWDTRSHLHYIFYFEK